MDTMSIEHACGASLNAEGQQREHEILQKDTLVVKHGQSTYNDSSEEDMVTDVDFKMSKESFDASLDAPRHILIQHPPIPRQDDKSSVLTDNETSERSAHALTSLPLPAKIITNLTKKSQQIEDSDVDDFTPAGPLSTRRRCVLVAKCLTNSDASSGRIILPRVAVEANLPFVTAYRHYALTVRDSTGRRYEFVIKSWANGTEHRRVFVLEQAAEYLRSHGVGVGDAIGICTDENGELVVETNTPEVRQATICPKYGALALAAPPPGSNNTALPLTASGRCIRSAHCTKPAGHPGFCSGPKAAAAASKAAGRHYHPHHRKIVELHNVNHSAHESQISEQAYMGDEYSSDETAATTVATPTHANLPTGLHPIAHVPAGIRLAKTLTAYDISSQRVVMPADDVNHGITNAKHVDILTLAAVDESQSWQFPTIRSWTSVAGRRGYILEDASKFLTSRNAQAGDVLFVYRDTDLTPPRIELRGQAGSIEQVRFPTQPDASSVTFAELPILMQPKGRPLCGGSHTGTPRATGGGTTNTTTTTSVGGVMMCNRTNGCTKAAGHQGFCSGHKGFKKREGGTPTAAMAAARYHAFRLRAGQKASSYDDYGEDYDWQGSDDEYHYNDHSPSYKRARKTVTTPRADDPLVSLLTLLDA